jgi:hypothetical protein
MAVPMRVSSRCLLRPRASLGWRDRDRFPASRRRARVRSWLLYSAIEIAKVLPCLGNDARIVVILRHLVPGDHGFRLQGFKLVERGNPHKPALRVGLAKIGMDVVIRDSRRLIAGSCTASKFYVKDRRLELMFPDRDAHTDHVNLQLSVVSAGCVIAPDCTEKLESTSTLRFQTSSSNRPRAPRLF